MASNTKMYVIANFSHRKYYLINAKNKFESCVNNLVFEMDTITNNKSYCISIPVIRIQKFIR